MKRYRLHIWPIWLLLGMMFLAACQSDALPGDDLGGGKPIVAHSDSSYINLRIVNNQTPMTRATEAATAKENAIYDGILCIFEGTSESEATLKTATVIDQLINNPGVNGIPNLNITQRLAIGTHDYGPNLYVLALLNTTSTGFKVGGANNSELLFDGVSKKNATISQIQNLVIHSVGSTEEHVGLFMSNAPLDGSIMPRVASSYLFDTEAAAASGGKLTINVERAAARVKVTNTAAAITTFNLDGDPNRHPTVHRMTWALHNYNTQSYAIRKNDTAAQNWATSVRDHLISFTNSGTDAFDLYQQHSYKDGDAVYIAENTTTTVNDQTQVFVEVQLKEGSFLLGDCFKYSNWDAEIFFTSAEKFIQYCKVGWKTTFASLNTGLTSKSADEVFKYPSLVINTDGSVTVTLKNDSFTTSEQTALAGLSNTLSGLLRGYRDGKVYYTYKIKHDTNHEFGVVRNNAYNLNFTSVPAIGDPVPTPIVVTP